MLKDLLLEQGPGSSRNYYYQVPETELEFPLTIIKGQQAGPVLLITAGMHGSEYPGIEAAKTLIQETDPATLKGTLLILPCLNPQAFYERTAFFNPADGRNPNRCFPGDPAGTETQKLAYLLEREFFSLTDFYLDFHSGDIPERLEAFVFIPSVGDEAVFAAAKAGADQLALPFGVISHSTVGGTGQASRQGVPALLIERGGFGERLPEMIAGFIEDAQRIMAHLDMVQQTFPPAAPLKLLEKVNYFDSPVTGLWYPALEVGDQITTGQLLGTIEDFFGTCLFECRAEHNGQILYQIAGLPINAGEHLIAYGY